MWPGSIAWTAPSHYLNQCWNIIDWTLRNTLQWNLSRNYNIFIQENVFESVVCEMAAILSRPQCVYIYQSTVHSKNYVHITGTGQATLTNMDKHSPWIYPGPAYNHILNKVQYMHKAMYIFYGVYCIGHTIFRNNLLNFGIRHRLQEAANLLYNSKTLLWWTGVVDDKFINKFCWDEFVFCFQQRNISENPTSYTLECWTHRISPVPIIRTVYIGQNRDGYTM